MKAYDMIYKILDILEDALDSESEYFEDINRFTFEVSENKFERVIEIMHEAELITQPTYYYETDDEGKHYKVLGHVRITLKGLEYLADNTATARIIKAAKLFKETIPGI